MVTVNLLASRTTWLDTGIVLSATDRLIVTAPDTPVLWAGGPTLYAFPEGAYYPPATASTHSEDPSSVVQTPDDIDPIHHSSELPATNLPPMLLAMAIRADGSGAPASHISDGLRPNRSKAFLPADLGGVGGRVWIIFNDYNFTDNSSSWNVVFNISCAGTAGLGYSDPLTLAGTEITGATSDMRALATRVHRAAKVQENTVEAWYFRDGAWNLFPIQPAMAPGIQPSIQHTYRQPSTATWLIPDSLGLLVTQNKNSEWNYNGGNVYDPIIDSSRKVLLRAGVLCYTNLSCGETVTSTLAPSSGALTSLVDGILGDISSSGTGYVHFAPSGVTPFNLVVDLGSLQMVRHAVIRFATKSGTCTLPAAVEFAWSADNSVWNVYCTRPVGGSGSGSGGDWDDDADQSGSTIEVIKTDLALRGINARYIRFRITPQGAQTIYCDEMVVYGGSQVGFLGANVFCGYLGAGTDTTNDSHIVVQATDTLKKLSDNYTVKLTAQFGVTPVETADILYALLTGATYWRGTGFEYDAPFAAGDIGWTIGANTTAFKWPVWQGQSNNMLGYCYELVNAIGWEMYADGNGVLQLREPPHRQLLPDRVFIADVDGNGDAWRMHRSDDDTDLRNVVVVNNGDPTVGGVGAVVKIDPSSIARYGRREVDITDPIATDQPTREKIADYVLRDYGWRLTKLNLTLRPDFETHVKASYGFRAALRPSLYSKAATHRIQEHWLIETMTHRIGVGEWEADCQLTPYVAQGPSSPVNIQATPEIVLTSFVDVSWDNVADLDVIGYYIWVSAVSETAFPQETTPYFTAPNGSPRSTFPVPGLTPGTQYWFYVTAVGANGSQSVPSAVVSAIAGGAAGDDSKWTVTDLVTSFNAVAPPAAGASPALYEYTIFWDWTSPPVGASTFEQNNYGFKQGEFRISIGSLPSSPLLISSWQRLDEWHGDRIPSLLTWDRLTADTLQFYTYFKVASNLSGQTIYCRMFTWQTTNGQSGQAHPSNVASFVVP